jgi:hypothetical protein
MAADGSMQTQPVEPLYCAPRGNNGQLFVNGCYFAEDVVCEHFDQETVARDFTPYEPIPTFSGRVANLEELTTAVISLRHWILSDVGQATCRPLEKPVIPSGHVPSINGNQLVWDALCDLNDNAMRLGSVESYHPSQESSRPGHISERQALIVIDRLLAWIEERKKWELEFWSEEKSPQEWAKQFGISVLTLKHDANAGHLAIKVETRKSWRISRASLQKYRRNEDA